MYKDVPVTICMRGLKHVEQYECIRILLATRTKDISICTHEATLPQVEKLLQKLEVQFVQCFADSQQLRLILEQ
jgi:hypothetical protein